MRGQISFVNEKWVFFFFCCQNNHINEMSYSDSLFVARSPS